MTNDFTPNTLLWYIRLPITSVVQYYGMHQSLNYV